MATNFRGQGNYEAVWRGRAGLASRSLSGITIGRLGSGGVVAGRGGRSGGHKSVTALGAGRRPSRLSSAS